MVGLPSETLALWSFFLPNINNNLGWQWQIGRQFYCASYSIYDVPDRVPLVPFTLEDMAPFSTGDCYYGNELIPVMMSFLRFCVGN